MLRLSISILFLASLLVACGKGADKNAKDANEAATRLLVGAEDVVTVQADALSSGPAINGSIQPERRADLRAEVSAVVLQVFKDNGDAVHKGDLLVRLDDTTIRDSLTSANEAERAATQTFDQAQRQFERLKTLRESGMTSTQQLEDAEIRRNNAQSDLSAAKTRVAQARQQLARTEARAPFDGIVSERKVSAGDTAQVGKELLKVIDPRSMRLEALVSADAIRSVAAGQVVRFRINGYGNQDFDGKVRRVNPSANALTRQAEVLVDFVGSDQPRLAGLYAEGRIETGSSPALLVPESVLQREGDKVFVWQINGNKLAKLPVSVGARDVRTGQYAIQAGVTGGQRLLRTAEASFKDGQAVEMLKLASTPPRTGAVPAASAAAMSKRT